MDLTLTPDTYVPILNNGNYVDKVPNIQNGIYCPCGSRHNKVYNHQTFTSHIRTKYHQKWLQEMNENKANHYVEMLKYKELVENQKIIIKKMETQLQTKILTIDYLTQQLYNKDNTITYDLLEIE